jgi:DNA polymerase III subunit delta'
MQFAQVYGHQKIKEQLIRNVENNRLPHAQLFLGNEGSGKLGLAIALTQYIYCTERTPTDSCGVCSSCRKISSHSHPDVHFTYPVSASKEISTQHIEKWREINASSMYFNTTDWMEAIAKDGNKTPNITREETRSILSRLSLKPYEGEAKTLIIWMPEYLKKESNVLLKLIEEPPQKTYFILVAEQSKQLLPTITSRTQLTKIPSYSYEETHAFLDTKYGLEKSSLEQIARLSDGNLRMANNLIENNSNDYGSLFRDWMLACYRNDLKSVSDISDKLHAMGKNQIQLFLTHGIGVLRECMLHQTIDNYTINAESSQVDFIQKLSSTLNAFFIEKIYTQINEVIYHLQRNANPKIALFNLSINIRYHFIRK